MLLLKIKQMQKGAGILIKTLYVIYILLVAFFCFFNISLPDVDLARYFLGIRYDRYAHFLMFFPYPFIAWLTCKYSRHLRKWTKYSLLITFFSGIILAVLTELIQGLLLSNREGDILDFASDFCGIALGTIIVSLIGHWMVRTVERIFQKQNTHNEKTN